MGFKDVLKKIGKGVKTVLPIVSLLFPQLSFIEKLSRVTGMTSAEKQQLAIELFQVDLLKELLPDQVEKLSEDPLFIQKLKAAIDANIALENYVRTTIKVNKNGVSL